MHKITKGLKKKKKGKKSKKNDDDLFNPEELEKYRKQHQGTSEESAPQSEEWKKFLDLTSGVDDILKKTQGDLDRIKNTSFFQRKPTESEVRKSEERKVEKQKQEEKARHEAEAAAAVTSAQLGIVEVSESESEEEEDDSIFDTTYIDVIAAGEVKLAYIPESPTENQDGDDPFDTSIAERAILGPALERKGKKLVPLGAAVEVLTGRVERPTCATKKSPRKREIVKERDLLLGSFDETSSPPVGSSEAVPEEAPKTLLDEDPIPLTDVPVDLSKPIFIPQQSPIVAPTNQPLTATYERNAIKKDLQEFDVITQQVDDEDLEFELLAAESLSKSSNVINTAAPVITALREECQWNAFETESSQKDDFVNDDPFDTTFADNILPDLKTASSKLVNGNYFENNSFALEKRIPDTGINFIKPDDRDLLGGSNVDLTAITTVQETNSQIDPFETTGVARYNVVNDDDFDPRATETYRERTVSRPDVLNITVSKTVSFDIPSTEEDLLNTEATKVTKPLTPFYIRKSSVPGENSVDETGIDDPFDTTFATNLAPGKAELKVIENELLDPSREKTLILEDKNFDPRDEQRAKIDEVVNTIKEISKPKTTLSTVVKESVDLLAIDNDISAKVLTPGDTLDDFDEILYKDPFDTSIACNILPGKTELKLLENELIFSDTSKEKQHPVHVEKCVDDLLVQKEDIVIEKPLSPSENIVQHSIEDQEFDLDFDPFDTSSINNIQPGKVELKLLESEFIQ